jgi:spore coat polysaccharide biosynthesis protein SpsF
MPDSMTVKRVVAVVQARMGSTRLPGKVLKLIAGKPLLGYLLERLERAVSLDAIVVATSESDADLPLAKYCHEQGIACFRGSETNVLERFYKTAQFHLAKVVVRICGDSPLVDPEMVDELVNEFNSDVAQLDYLTNTLNQTCPLGTNIEVFSFIALAKAFAEADTKYQQEHVTPYFYQNPGVFRIREKHYEPDNSRFRLTVDTPEDLSLIENIITAMAGRNPDMPLQSILAFLEANPDLLKINEHVQQNRIVYTND